MISVSRFFTGIENMETSGRLAFGMLIRFFLYRTNKSVRAYMAFVWVTRMWEFSFCS